MNIALLGSSASWYFHDLVRAAAGRHEITAVTFKDLWSDVCSTGSTLESGGFDLKKADCVLVRTMPPGTLEQVVFRMDALAELEAAGRLVINPPRGVEAAVDKYLTTMRLQRAGLLVPRTIVCQTADAGMAAFASLGGDVVMKPLFGGEGRGITRLADDGLAERAFRMIEQLGGVLYLQQFVPHEGCDLRLLVIGRRVLGIRRVNKLDWRTNVSRGAKAEPLEVTPELAEMAHQAAAAVGLPLAGIDLLPGRDGRLYAIEVNAVPGWRALAAALKIDVARMVLELVESSCH
ncbi:MAG: RimK family alpha-L-glutamate ligase [Planctomycetes bacterium]|nr:RimK family alpha-L-glutamate ligase [Planctomycetota bacterium]